MRKGDRERERERENARESESERESGTNKIETERRDLLSTNSTLMMCDLCDVVFVIQKTRMSYKRPPGCHTKNPPPLACLPYTNGSRIIRILISMVYDTYLHTIPRRNTT